MTLQTIKEKINDRTQSLEYFFHVWAGAAILFFIILFLLLVSGFEANAQPLVSRVKDIATLDGIQDNPLIGYGLVGGLAGTGDGRRGFTAQTLTNLLAGMGINVLDPDLVATEVVPDNVAAVIVLANLPPFARPGTRIDTTIVSIGRAESLQGGTLFPTPLKGADGKIHGIASGDLSIGGFRSAAGGGGGGAASVQENHPVVARIPKGAIIEGEPVFQNVLQDGNTLRWLLHEPDFKTASNLERKINSLCGYNIAIAEDAGAVRLFIAMDDQNHIVLGNQSFGSLVSAIAYIDDAQIETDEPARIVINERTGTIVAGQDIKVRNVVIAHGALRITIQTTPEAVPAGFGATVSPTTIDQTNIQAQTGDKVTVVKGTTIGEVVADLNRLGFTPRDLIAILQAMASAGAIKAEVMMMK